MENYIMNRKSKKLKSLGFSENFKNNFVKSSIHVEVINNRLILLHSPFYSLITFKELKSIMASN